MKFCVELDDCTRNGETVFVTGSCADLGGWDHNKAVQLHRETLTERTNDKEIWSCSVDLPTDEHFTYRYFVGTTLYPDTPNRTVIVNHWEASAHPRNSAEHDNDRGCEKYGLHGDDGRTCMRRGWLTSQTEIHIHFHSDPILIWKPKHVQEQYRIKCCPFHSPTDQIPQNEPENQTADVYTCNSDESYVSPTLVSVLYEHASSKRLLQPPCGSLFNEDGYIIFSMQVMQPKHICFQFDIYLDDPTEASHKHIGTAYSVPGSLVDSMGQKLLCIHGNDRRPLGQITVEYLLCTPLSGPPCDMSMTHPHDWKQEKRVLHVGHRGMGSTLGDDGLFHATENTIASFSEAHRNGADMVEMDLQITKDFVPIIYHDFQVCFNFKKFQGRSESPDWFQIPVKDLAAAQLQTIKFNHISKSELHPDEVDPHISPFPTLRQCFELLDEDLGFNLEIKFPIKDIDGVDEQDNYFDKNTTMDILLKEILEHAGSRQIVMSTFDPDSCVLLRLKQNRYPVLFLSQGQTTRWKGYKDLRSRTLPIGRNFVIAEELAGLAVESGELLKNLPYISDVRGDGLLLYSWGRDNESPEVRRLLEKNGVHGIVYDGISDLGSSRSPSLPSPGSLCAIPDNTVPVISKGEVAV